MFKVKIFLILFFILIVSSSVNASLSIVNQQHINENSFSLRNFNRFDELGEGNIINYINGSLNFRNFQRFPQLDRDNIISLTKNSMNFRNLERFPILSTNNIIHTSNSTVKLRISSSDPFAHCDNTIKDADEEGIDCGGSCPPCETCYDDIQNQDEEGIDCGGSCPFVCGGCKPYIDNGPHHEKIDVVFVPDEDYKDDLDTFVDHIGDIINNSYKESQPINDNLEKFNFYYIENFSNSDWSKWRHNLPRNFYSECSFFDAAAIVHKVSHRDFAGGGVFSSEYNSYGTFVHESGHAIFGLADEYCCDSSYFRPRPFPNIWPNDQSCRSDATSEGWDPDDCNQFCPPNQGTCGRRSINGWWRSDPDPDIMRNSGLVSNPFERADLRNVYWTFDQYPGQTVQSLSQIASESENNAKVLLLDLLFINSSINVTNVKIVYNDAPEYNSLNGDINLTLADKDNNILRSILFWDPRIVVTENESVYLDEGNITIPIKTSFNEKYAYIYNTSNDLLLMINLSDYINSFCRFKDGRCDPGCVEVKDADCNVEFNISLTQGWNLISIPLSLENLSAEYILNDLNYSKIFGYDSDWIVPEQINNTMGYWIKMNSSYLMKIYGFEVNESILTLKPGWNLIGYPSLNEKNSNEIFNNSIINVFSFDNNQWFSYNPLKINNSLEIIKPGYGYWVKVDDNASLVIS